MESYDSGTKWMKKELDSDHIYNKKILKTKISFTFQNTKIYF